MRQQLKLRFFFYFLHPLSGAHIPGDDGDLKRERNPCRPRSDHSSFKVLYLKERRLGGCQNPKGSWVQDSLGLQSGAPRSMAEGTGDSCKSTRGVLSYRTRGGGTQKWRLPSQDVGQLQPAAQTSSTTCSRITLQMLSGSQMQPITCSCK